MPTVTDGLLNTTQAAVYLGVSRRQVQVLATQRRIAHRRLGRLLRFTQADLDAYIDSCRVDAKPTSAGEAGGAA